MRKTERYETAFIKTQQTGYFKIK
jgi:hypothetical protein